MRTKSMELGSPCTPLPPGEGGCPGGPQGPSRQDVCGLLMCVLGNSFLHSENRDHQGAEAWIFSECHFLKRSQGRVAVLGSLLGQARSRALQAEPPWPACPAETVRAPHPSKAPAAGLGTLSASHTVSVTLGSGGPRLALPRGLCTGHPSAWSRSAPGAAGMWHCHLGQAWGCAGSGVQPWCLCKTAPCPHIPAFAGGSHQHRCILSLMFVLYY